MAVLYRKPHYSEACYNEVELYLFAKAVLTSTHNLCFGAKIRKISRLSDEIFIFYNCKNLCTLHGQVFVMKCI